MCKVELYVARPPYYTGPDLPSFIRKDGRCGANFLKNSSIDCHGIEYSVELKRKGDSEKCWSLLLHGQELSPDHLNDMHALLLVILAATSFGDDLRTTAQIHHHLPIILAAQEAAARIFFRNFGDINLVKKLFIPTKGLNAIISWTF